MGYFNFIFFKFLKRNYKKIFYFLLLFLILFSFIKFVFANRSISFTYSNTDYTLNLTGNMDQNHVLVGYSGTSSGYRNFEVYSSSSSFYATYSNGRVYIHKTDSNAVVYNCIYYTRTNTQSTINTSAFGSGFSDTEEHFNNTYFAYCTDTLSYTKDGDTIVVNPPPESYNTLPYIWNTQDKLTTGGLGIFVYPGDFPNTKDIRFVIQIKKETIDEQTGNTIVTYNNLFSPVVLNKDSHYYVEDGNSFYYYINWAYIKPFISITNTYNYVIAYEINGEPGKQEIEAVYGGETEGDALYNQGLDQNQEINDQTQVIEEQTQAIEEQTQAIEEQTQAIEDINNTINDSSIESGASDLPSTNVQDITQNGIDNIFQSIYNAFCTGQAQNIVFPIPFTNKNITLSPYYVRDMLNNNGASWVYTLIQAFWGYLIGRFIVKDISRKINKIKSGDVENIENNNIKEEML